MRTTTSMLLSLTAGACVLLAILANLGVFSTSESTLNARTVAIITAAPSFRGETINLPQIIESLKREYGIYVDLDGVIPTTTSLAPHYKYDNLKSFLCSTLWQMGLSFRVKAGRISIGKRQISDRDYYLHSIDCVYLWCPNTDEHFKENAG